MLKMFSRSGIAGGLVSACLAAACFPGFCADNNNPDISAPVMAANGVSGTNAMTDPARVLSPNDVILLTVYGEDDLTTKTIIDKNGMVMLPLLGQVKISGLTVGQATKQIQQLYDKDYLVKPQVNLIVEQFALRRFSVLGQVQRPGSFDFPQNDTVNLLEAIAMGGGYTRLGSPSKVTVRRLENGVTKVYHLDAGKMASVQTEKPFEILPNDVVDVGERTF